MRSSRVRPRGCICVLSLSANIFYNGTRFPFSILNLIILYGVAEREFGTSWTTFWNKTVVKRIHTLWKESEILNKGEVCSDKIRLTNHFKPSEITLRWRMQFATSMKPGCWITLEILYFQGNSSGSCKWLQETRDDCWHFQWDRWGWWYTSSRNW